jgi:hypothetical protein
MRDGSVKRRWKEEKQFRHWHFRIVRFCFIRWNLQTVKSIIIFVSHRSQLRNVKSSSNKEICHITSDWLMILDDFEWYNWHQRCQFVEWQWWLNGIWPSPSPRFIRFISMDDIIMSFHTDSWSSTSWKKEIHFGISWNSISRLADNGHKSPKITSGLLGRIQTWFTQVKNCKSIIE